MVFIRNSMDGFDLHRSGTRRRSGVDCRRRQPTVAAAIDIRPMGYDGRVNIRRQLEMEPV